MKNNFTGLKFLMLSIAVLSIALFSPVKAADPNVILNRWNAIIVKDLLNVGEIEGRVFIGGNYSVPNSHQFGFKLNNNLTSDIVFATAGNLTTNGQANIKVFYGSASVASAVQTPAWFQFMQSGGTLSAPSDWPAANSPVADMIAASAYWRTLTANSNAQIPSGKSGPLKLECSDNDAVAVFNLTDLQTLDNPYAQQIELHASSVTTTVIINVNSLDGAINWNAGNMVAHFNNDKWRSRVIWNIYTDANNGHMGTINLNGNFKGTLVSPTATVVTNSNIDGSVVVENLNIQSEIHMPSGGWQGEAPSQDLVQKLTDWSGTIDPSESICQHDAGWISTNGSVQLTPSEVTNARLQTSWQIVSPNDGSADNSVHYSSVQITKGTSFSISGYWPGVRPEDKLVKIHYGVNVLDADGKQIKGEIGRDIYWDPTVCPAPLPKQADMKIEKTVSNASPENDESITYYIKATNNGPGKAMGVLVSDVLPAGLTYISHNIDQGTYEPATGLWTLGNLDSGAVANLSILVKVNFEKIYSSVFDLGPAKDYNLFVLQDLTQPSSDTEGKIAVGRDATLSQYSVGNKLPASSGDVLVVGRKLTFNSGRVYNGSAVYGDSTNFPSIIATADSGVHKGNPLNFSAAKSYLESLSTSLSGYAATGNLKYQYGKISLSGSDPYLNVFSVSGADLSGSTDFQITLPKGAVALVNVDGSNLSWSGGHRVTGTAVNNVLFNFHEAKTINISGIGIEGSILAPNADVIFKTGVQYGQMICKSLNGSAQFNNLPFIGNIPVAKTITNIASVTGSASADNNVSNNSSAADISPRAPKACTIPYDGISSGKSWKELGSFAQGEMVYTIIQDSSSMYAGTVGGKIYKSTDAGKTWGRINNDMSVGWIWSLCFNNGKLFASTEKGVYKLSGESWLATELKDKDVRALAALNGSLFAGTWGDGVFRSDDYGNSWAAINDGFNGSSAVQTLVFDGQSDLFAGTFDGGLFKLNAGESKWINHPLGSNAVWALGYSSGTMYAALYGDGLYSSADNGNSWTYFENLDMPYIYSIQAGADGTVYASSWTSGIYCSVNSGNSWSSLGMGGSGVTSLAINSSEKTAVAGTRDGKIFMLDSAELTSVTKDKSGLPSSFSLSQNYPNPFNPSTAIEVSIPQEGKYSIKVYNILGQEVRSLLQGDLKAGVHTFHFSDSNLASGVYIYRLTGSGVNLTKKMLLMK